jgi:hypothetical protein
MNEESFVIFTYGRAGNGIFPGDNMFRGGLLPVLESLLKVEMSEAICIWYQVHLSYERTKKCLRMFTLAWLHCFSTSWLILLSVRFVGFPSGPNTGLAFFPPFLPPGVFL